MTLSVAQIRALQKIGAGWVTAYDIQESMATLNSLVRLKYLASRGQGNLGSSFSPRTTVEYRRIGYGEPK